MPSKLIRVGIADDHPSVRAGLEALFSRSPGFEFAGAAAGGQEAISLLLQQSPDVLVMDINMPQVDGLEVMVRLAKLGTETRVVIYSGFPEDQYAQPFYWLGAKGYVDKAAPLADLLETVRVVHAGGVVFSTTLWNSTVHRIAADKAAGPVAFTTREFQVFLSLAAGRTVGEISQQVGISTQSISTTRSKLLRKLGLSTNAQLTRYALDNGFIQGGC